MPESRTLILGALVILLGLLVSALLVDKAITLSESYELELNASWDEGWNIGYAWGAYNIFVEVIERGIYAFNETWVLYSPDGCGAAFIAELENRGCEVVCAGR